MNAVRDEEKRAMDNSVFNRLWLIDSKGIYHIEDIDDVPDIIASLIKEEFQEKYLHDNRILSEIESIMNELGYEWDSLAEVGYPRFKPYAVTINEVLGKRIWRKVKLFGENSNIPIYRIEGGELYSLNNNDIKNHTILAEEVGMYGRTIYRVNAIDNQILRFSACCNKLGIAQGFDIKRDNLPFGLFEISKSYRYEEENRLRIGERCRCFRLPELHILNDSIPSALSLIIEANEVIKGELYNLQYQYVVLCSVTSRFFKNNIGFIQKIACTNKYPMLIYLVPDDNEMCENGVQFDIEYKALTSYGGFLEIATLQLDDGSTGFSYGIKYNDIGDGNYYPVCTIHAVFSASIERSAYVVAERAAYNKKKNHHYYIPFELAPIQCRILLDKDANYRDIENRLIQLKVRYDIDDRNINIEEKLSATDLKYIPYIVFLQGRKRFYDTLNDKNMAENEFWNIIEKECWRGDVSSYVPILLSQRFDI